MILLAFVTFLALGCVLLSSWCRVKQAEAYAPNTVGFVHPAATAGGGGERVLWIAIQALMESDQLSGEERRYVVFCSGLRSVDGSEVLRTVERQFGITLPRPVKFVFLRPSYTQWLNGDRYPVASLLLQMLVGGLLLFYECAVVNTLTPIVVETVGIPMLYPLVTLLSGSTLAAYVHYPVISPLMVTVVRTGTQSCTNKGAFATSPTLKWIKVVYYFFLTGFYRLLGQFPHLVMTNSSWTQRQVAALFWPRTTSILFPPCPVRSCSPGKAARRNRVVSLGQFRAEKNHRLQIEAFHLARRHLPRDTTLVLIGGARNEEDLQRVEELRSQVRSLGLEDCVELKVNVPRAEIDEELRTSFIGLHSMKDEHFGIVMVEFMAAGCIALAHRSGGVALDIIKSPDLGFLAETAEEYAECMTTIMNWKSTDDERVHRIRKSALAHALHFGDQEFKKRFVTLMEPLLLPSNPNAHVNNPLHSSLPRAKEPPN